MGEISVTMLGHFDILAEGTSALAGLGNSSKSILLLKFLLLNRGKSVPVTDLVNLFWSEPEKSANPESALKTMISRVRFSLAGANPSLKNCILSENKAYLWNPEIPLALDVFLFEGLCKALEKTEALDDAAREGYMRALTLYAGDLSSSPADADWILSRSLYLHHLYLTTVLRFIALLKEESDFDSIIHVCRIALEVDAFDETLNIEMMNALAESGRRSPALAQYRHVAGAYSKYLGAPPSGRMQDFYENLLRADVQEEAGLAGIRQELRKEDGEDVGAFVCDYSIFRDIYLLLSRNLERQENRMFLALVTASPALGEEFEPLVLDALMRDLLGILRIQLRRGDVIARCGSCQYAALLSMESRSGAAAVFARIKKAFYRQHAGNGCKVSFRVEETA